MAIEDTFNGAKNGFASYFGYLNTVAQEMGMGQAIAFLTKKADKTGAMLGKIMKEQTGDKEFDAMAAWSSVVNSLAEDLGMTPEVLEESPQRVVFKTGKCPIYEAGRMMGLDAETIEMTCRSDTTWDTMFKVVNPNLSHRLRKFRSGPDDFCEEEIVLG